MRDVYQEYMDTCHDFYDIYPEERMRDVSRPNYNPNERPPTPEAMKTPPGPPKGYFSPIFPLAYRRIMQVRSHSLLLLWCAFNQVLCVCCVYSGVFTAADHDADPVPDRGAAVQATGLLPT